MDRTHETENRIATLILNHSVNYFGLSCGSQRRSRAKLSLETRAVSAQHPIGPAKKHRFKIAKYDVGILQQCRHPFEWIDDSLSDLLLVGGLAFWRLKIREDGL